MVLSGENAPLIVEPGGNSLKILRARACEGVSVRGEPREQHGHVLGLALIPGSNVGRPADTALEQVSWAVNGPAWGSPA
jgi:hypothetical protein